ncbi:hypothetical protein MXB_4168 [Myxobolus squamalis]|nr:hypothetical protein MXB_4168 [Myxobolus squamalis]
MGKIDLARKPSNLIALEYDKVERLASLAMQHTNNNNVRAFSYYLLGKCYHVKDNYENSFNYYYQASQIASPKFVLPWFGLGQIHLRRDEIDSAINCFEKVLSMYPDNVEASQLVCLCYLKSNNTSHVQKARVIKIHITQGLYKKMVTLFPEEEECWIGLSEISQSFDIKESLGALEKAKFIMEAKKLYISPEMLNNMGSLHYRSDDYVQAKKYFELALSHVDQSSVLANVGFNPITATIRYNLAHACEKLAEIEKAESLYHNVLTDFPDYIDCYLRLGQLAKSRGDFREASDWFNSALKENSEAWLHIANLHLLKHEFGPAQKKFEKVIASDKNNPDTYAWLSLGNIWLSLLHSSLHDPEKKKKFSDRCLNIYKNVIKIDSKNICAANGIGCILAYNSHTSLARDLFSQCREATADILDIWMNLGHIYMESKQYINAIKMYESCHEKFSLHSPSPDILIYLARAYFKAGQLLKAKAVLLKLLFYSPRDILALFNFSLILVRNASFVLKNDRATLKEVESAISGLELAKILDRDGEHSRIDSNACENEKRACCDMIIQGKHRFQRAKQQEEEEAKMMKTHIAQLEEITRLKAIENEQEAKNQKERQQELIQKRTEYLKNAQNTLLIMPSISDEKSRYKKSRQNKDETEDTDNILRTKSNKRKKQSDLRAKSEKR